MVDLHSHIIPYVDDGAQNLEETFEILKEAEKEGFTEIVLTPHFLLGYYEENCKDIAVARDFFNEELEKRGMKLRVHVGNEVYITSEIEKILKEKRILTIANSKYLLMELPINAKAEYFDFVMDTLDKLKIKVILAHPERYLYVQKDPKLVEEFIEKGCLIQCNYGSLLGDYGRFAKKTIKYLLKNNQVDFIASDCHRENSIYPRIGKAIKKLNKICGEKKVEEITTINPKRIIDNL